MTHQEKTSNEKSTTFHDKTGLLNYVLLENLFFHPIPILGEGW